jgi:hypothetical protein
MLDGGAAEELAGTNVGGGRGIGGRMPGWKGGTGAPGGNAPKGGGGNPGGNENPGGGGLCATVRKGE